VFDDEELTEEKIANKTGKPAASTSCQLKSVKASGKADNIPNWRTIFAQVEVARTHGNCIIRAIVFNPFEKKRLIDKMRGTVERLQSLEREAGRLERRADVAKATCPKREGIAQPARRAEGHRRGQRSRADGIKAHSRSFLAEAKRTRQKN
jgi:hypothetical protein